MSLKQIFLVFAFVMMKDGGRVSSKKQWCCRSNSLAPAEGVLGSVDTFPWLGVLRVHLHQDATLKVALTGIVFVKDIYAIGNADDIARIPKRIFQEDSRAMFIPTKQTPWFCKVVDYMTHPEYEVDTINSIALVELDPGDKFEFPMKPACWPPHGSNVTTNLYALGYTDENEKLEKIIHKLQYVEPDLCKEFYKRAGLEEGLKAPQHFTCGFAPNNTENCVWENGMALASNASGHWVLVGLGLHGPGCAAPARFIALAEYYSWIESATNVQAIEDEDQEEYRRIFRKGVQPKPQLEYIPIHELLRSKPDGGEHKKHDFAHYHPYDVLIHEEDLFHVTRIDKTQIHLVKWRQYFTTDRYGNCSMPGLRLVYRDDIKINFIPDAPGMMATARYKLSLYDDKFSNYTCVVIKLDAFRPGPALLDYATMMEDGTLFPENPPEVMLHYPQHTLSRLHDKKPNDDLQPDPIRSPGFNFSAHHVNLFLKVVFRGSCTMKIAFFGPLTPTTTIKPSITTTTKTNLRGYDSTNENKTLIQRHEHTEPIATRVVDIEPAEALVEGDLSRVAGAVAKHRISFDLFVFLVFLPYL